MGSQTKMVLACWWCDRPSGIIIRAHTHAPAAKLWPLIAEAAGWGRIPGCVAERSDPAGWLCPRCLANHTRKAVSL